MKKQKEISMQGLAQPAANWKPGMVEYGPHGEILTCESCGSDQGPFTRIPIIEERAFLLRIDQDEDTGAELCRDCLASIGVLYDPDLTSKM